MKKISPDKWKHFFVGIPLGVVVQLACYYFLPLQLVYTSLVSIIILLSGCYAFELFSLITGKGHYELWDVAAGMAGGLIGVTIVLIAIKAGII